MQTEKNVIIASNVEIVDQKLNHIKYHKLSDNLEKYPLSYLAFDITTGLNGCALFIPKKLFEKNGYFNLDLKVTQDYDMWSRFAINEHFIILDKVLVKSRQHPEQGSKTIKTVQDEVDNLHSKFIKKIEDKELLSYFNNDLDKMFDTILLFKNAMQSYNAAIELYKRIYKLFKKTKKQELLRFYNINFLDEENSNFKITNSKLKKILFYSNIWIKGGIERVLSIQFETLHKKYDIYFLTTKIDEENGFKIPDYVNVIKISENIGNNIGVAILSLCKILDINLFINNQNLNVEALSIYKLLRKNNIKTIASNHYSYYLPAEFYNMKEIFMEKDNFYKEADAVVWTNSISANIHSLKMNNAYYIPNPNTYKTEKKPTKNNYNIVCVGRFDDSLKHIELTLEAFSKALKSNGNLKLIVVGKINKKMKTHNTKNETLSQVIKRLNIPNENIEFVGQSDNVSKYYKESSLHIITSQSEGFGMVITEAASFGVPTISFDILGVQDIIKNNENGYLIECYNIEEMSNKIVEYFSSFENMNNMKLKTLEQSKKFSKELVSKEWENLIDNVINDKFVENIHSNISQEQLVKIFDQTILNINNNIGIFSSTIYAPKTFLGRMYSKVVYQYQKYGLKKTIKEIIYYPIKIAKKIINKILKK